MEFIPLETRLLGRSTVPDELSRSPVSRSKSGLIMAGTAGLQEMEPIYQFQKEANLVTNPNKGATHPITWTRDLVVSSNKAGVPPTDNAPLQHAGLRDVKCFLFVAGMDW